MSEAFGPRAHPERCDDEFAERPPRRSYEESLGTALGVLAFVIVIAIVVLWWVEVL